MVGELYLNKVGRILQVKNLPKQKIEKKNFQFTIIL